MAARTGGATWTGDLRDGSGQLVVGPQRWEAAYSFRSRFSDDTAGSTNPEELLAAAHAGCFSLSLTHLLTQAGGVPRSVATSARVRLRPVDGVPTIDLVELDTTVDVEGIDADALQKHVEAAEAGCGVSRALAGVAEIRVTARRRA
ncbi:OsmC family peroxiredoxin [Geodermatophilus sp. YIM 151500]|uniref:OsmC family peroxiredoxin n=1 Tax=Geodermatophilus sp. YIM 151500 TaxID=2984531 RepID=UPI0021E47A6C|nr:OsmC family peroxiredoxin [Geodermatophilus sp. YIM 151500]MCV2489793.1 OsmC family peroxiredoxin [Geodermatophilus sp. YIM 151500]